MSLFMSMKPVSCLSISSIVVSVVLLSGCGGDPSLDSSLSKYTPKGVVASPGTRAVSLGWSGVAGASGYTVYWSQSEDVSKTNGAAIDTTETSLDHRGLANDTPYYYVVTAHVNTGESLESRRVSAIPKPAPPGQPQEFKIKAEDRRITLTWSEDTVGVGSGGNDPGAVDYSGYSLYWDTQANLDPTINPINPNTSNRIENASPPFVHGDLSNGQTYYYYLVAENQYGQSTATSILSAQPQKPAPTAPTITAAIVSGGTVELQWQDASNAESFDLYWNTQGNVSTTDSKITQVTSPYFHPVSSDGRSYYYRLLARNSGGVSTLSNEAQVNPPTNNVVIPKPTPPSIPQLGVAEIHDSRVNLIWNAVTGASGYNLYWKSAAGGVTSGDNVIRNIQPPYTHIGLTNGTAYYYRVSAINDDGESGLSNEINRVPQVVVPGVPAGLRALAGNGWVAVRWTDVDKASGYNVQLDGTTVANNVTSPYTLQGLLNGTTYAITITALNGSTQSAASAPVTATPQLPPPSAPVNITAQPQDGQVTVQWDLQDPTDLVAVTGYKVYYRTRSGVTPGNGNVLNVIPSQDNNNRWQVTHSSLQNGQRYYYVVTALNANGGESLISQEAWARPQVPIPDAPSNVWTQAGDNQVVIRFTPAQNALSHNLYWTQEQADGTRSDPQVITSFQPGGIFTDGNANGNTYYFEITAFNNGGESPRTPEVSARPQIPPPQSPPQNLATRSGDAQVIVNWAAQTEATQGYVIYWSTEPNIDPSTSQPIVLGSTENTYTHTNLQNGQSYFYQIIAMNEGGGSALSEAVVARPQMPAPLTPAQAPRANIGDTTVTLTWPDVPAATGYTLYRSTNVEAPQEQWSRFDGVLSGYTDIGLSNNQRYSYALSASNPGGESGRSLMVSATPLAPLPGAPTGLIVIAGNNQVDLDWDTKTNLNYRLYWTINPAVDPINDVNPPLTNVRPTARHDSLVNDTTYRYQLTASNATGEGPPTPIVMATPSNGVPGNTAPVIQQGASVNVTMDEDNAPMAFNLSLNATDANNDQLQWRVSRNATNGNATVVATGLTASIAYMPTGNYNGNDSFTIEVDDGKGGRATTLVNVTIQSVNDVPVFVDLNGLTITTIPAISMSEDGSPTAFAITLNAKDNDPNDVITWRIMTQATNGSASIIGPSPATGSSKGFDYIPNANTNGNDSFVVQLNDGAGSTTSLDVNVIIQAVNDVPQLGNNNLSLIEGQTVIIQSVNMSATDIDTSDASLVFAASSITNGMFDLASNPGVAITNFSQADIMKGDLRFIHSSGQAAPNYLLSVSDGALTNVGGPKAASIIFTPSNAAPVIASVTPTTTQNILVGESVVFGSQATDKEDDAANIPLNYSWSFPPASGINDIFIANPGAVVFNSAGKFSINVTVSDSKSSTTQAFVNVNVNQPPIINRAFGLNGSTNRGCGGLPDYCNTKTMTVDDAGVATVYYFDDTTDVNTSHTLVLYNKDGLFANGKAVGTVFGVTPSWLVNTSTSTVSNVFLAGVVNNMTVWRYDKLGNLDISFGSNGRVSIPAEANSSSTANDIEIDNQQRIIVIGNNDKRAGQPSVLVDKLANIWRLDSTGVLDPTFGVGGVAIYNNVLAGSIDSGVAISVDAQNRVVALVNENTGTNGTNDLVLLRMDQNGILDTTFGVDYDNSGQKDGLFKLDNILFPGSTITGYSLIHDASGNIIVAGGFTDIATEDAFVMRFDTLGQWDKTFGGASGMLLFDSSKNEFVKELEINSAGEIFALVAQINPRYNDDAFFILHIDDKGGMIPTYANNGVFSGGGSPISFGFDSNNGVFVLNRSETNLGWRIWNYRYQ